MTQAPSPAGPAPAPLATGPRNDAPARWLAAFLLTALYAVILILQSLHAGALAVPAVYDDVSYQSDGARRLILLYQTGIGEFLRNTIAGPPHAPLSTGLAVLGFLLFGIAPWAAVAANALLLFVFVRMFYWVASELPVWRTTVLAAALLTAPFFAVALLECRPDMFCGLFIALGTLGIIARPWVGSRSGQLIAGVAFAAALWSKPVVFPLTVVMFGTAMGLASLTWLRRGQWRAPVGAALVTTAVALVLAAPYYLVAWRHVLDYIWTTVFGSEAGIWVRPLPRVESMLFYLTGPTGKVSLGDWLYLGLGIGVFTLVLLYVRRRGAELLRGLFIATMVLAVYAAVTYPAFKGPHGLPFAAVFLGASAIAAARAATLLPRVLSWAFCIVVALVGLGQFEWGYTRHFGAPIESRFAASRWTMLEQLYQATGPDTAGKTMLLTTSGVHINPTVLEFEYYRRGIQPPRAIDVQRRADESEHRRRIDESDLIFALTPDFKPVFPHLPTATPEFRAKVMQWIAESGEFKEPIRIVDPHFGGAVLIYHRLGDGLQLFADETNLADISGPFPQWGLPKVRWGYGKQSTIRAQGAPGVRARLSIQARTVPLPDQTLAVAVNGVTLLTPVRMTYDFQRFVIPFSYDAEGKAEIALQYGIEGPQAVLYKTLRVDAR